MPNFIFDDFARTTLAGAHNRADESRLSVQQVDEVVAYLKSPGSGGNSATSFADYVATQMQRHPPSLPADMDYLAFSGVDSSEVSNFTNASRYALNLKGEDLVDGKHVPAVVASDSKHRAGLIGDTPFGIFIEDVRKNPAQHPDFLEIQKGFKEFLDKKGIIPFDEKYDGALRDMMWNAGSPKFLENAIATGKPLLAFVENAPANRGFSNFELATALEHPNVRINGYPVSAFGADPLEFVSKSAAEYQALERDLAERATTVKDGDRLRTIRESLKPIDGYDAVNQTLFDRPVNEFKALSFDEMTRTRAEWIVARGTLPSAPRLQAEAPEHAPHAHNQPGAPRGPPGTPAATIAETATEAAPHRVPGGLSPGMKVAGIAGLALMAEDFGTTGHKWVQLHSAGNDAAAASTVHQFVGRNVGGAVGGFIAGAGVGLTTGSWTGPGAIVTGIGGGAFGAYLGDSWAKQKDIDRVYVQTDTLEREWRRSPSDPEGRWYRGAHQQQVQSGDLGNGVEVRPVQTALGDDVTIRTRYVAEGTLERQLNHKAAVASYGLGMEHLSPPRDPYRLDASAESRPPRFPSETGRAFVRDPASEQWQLEITQLHDGRATGTFLQAVAPERAALLDEQSRTVIAQNAANTPAALAARYMVAHEKGRWGDFGDAPTFIQDALKNANTVRASDGNAYTRQEDGQWLDKGVVFDTAAKQNLREELELTWQSQQAGVQGFASMAEQIKANVQLEPEGVRGQVEALYAKHGIERSPEQLDATAAAVQNSLGQTDKPIDVVLELMPDPRTHAPSPESAIAVFSDDGHNRMAHRSTTTMEDVAKLQSLHQPTTAPPVAPNVDPVPTLETVTVTAPHPELDEPRTPQAEQQPAQAAQVCRTLLPNDPGHSDHATYNKIHQWVQGTGNWNEEQCHNVSAALYKQQAENPMVQRVDRVTGALGPNGEHNVMAVYAPHGNVPPYFHAVVDGREAMHQPAQQNLQQAQEVKQEQVLQQQREQEAQKQAPPSMSM